MKRRPGSGVALALALGVVVAGSPGPALGDSNHRPPRDVLTEGDCEQIGAFIPVPVSRVREYVPNGFTPTGEQAGVAVVLVTGGRCDPWFIDGKEVPPLQFGLISVLIDPPAEHQANGYDLWWQTDHRRFYRGYTRLGISTEFVPDLRYETVRGPHGGVTSAFVDVPGEATWFSMEADLVAHAPSPGIDDIPSTHWHLGPHGLVLGVHDNDDSWAGGATIVIRTEPGSPLADILGGDTVTIAGGLLEFHHTATTGIVAD